MLACLCWRDFYNGRDALAFLVFIPDKAATKQFKPPQRIRCGAFFRPWAARAWSPL